MSRAASRPSPLLTAIAIGALLWPVFRRQPGAPRQSFELEVYRDQLAEIERDRERGLIGPDGGPRGPARDRAPPAARRPARPTGAGRGRAAGGHELLLLAAALLVPTLAATLYAALGSPGLPDQPLAQRQDRPPADPEPARRRSRWWRSLEARLADVAGRSRGLADARPLARRAGQRAGRRRGLPAGAGAGARRPARDRRAGRGADRRRRRRGDAGGQGAVHPAGRGRARATRAPTSIWAGPTPRPAITRPPWSAGAGCWRRPRPTRPGARRWSRRSRPRRPSCSSTRQRCWRRSRPPPRGAAAQRRGRRRGRGDAGRGPDGDDPRHGREAAGADGRRRQRRRGLAAAGAVARRCWARPTARGRPSSRR